MSAIQFKLNGQAVSVDTPADRYLLWVLRTELGLTGAKYGCGMGLCGACTVLVNGAAVRSCMVTLREVEGQDVVTIEGLADGAKLHPLQQAFVEHSAMQCGFCTPGMILGAHDLLEQNQNPTRAEVINGLDGHLCRCGAHPRIVDAVLDAAQQMKGGAQ
jgi:aerobic-type carbon monoxide dehydrogenase small subunit (CoxS/CutS family)